MKKPLRIDTHHHVVPPSYAAWLRAQGIHDAGGRELPDWSPEGALDVMETLGVEGSVLSVSTPGVHLGNQQEARAQARSVNEYAARVCADYPGRFGFFATLTLPDVDGALEEATYALDTLGADGVVLLANAQGIYLGDPKFDPLMEELQRRKTVVFVHPSELPLPPIPGVPAFAADFLLDTTRAALSMAKSGWLTRYDQVKIILSHGGGFVPYAAERMARVCSANNDYAEGIDLLQRYYFDTALTSSPYGLPSLLAFADPTRLTFGSDWPYAPKERSLHFATHLDAYALEDAQRARIHRDNALALFPRWRQREVQST